MKLFNLQLKHDRHLIFTRLHSAKPNKYLLITELKILLIFTYFLKKYVWNSLRVLFVCSS